MSNLDAARSDDHRRALVALRDSLAADLDGDTSNVRAQIAAQYRAVLKEISELKDGAEVLLKHDELKQRREARRAAASTVAIPVKKGRKRGA